MTSPAHVSRTAGVVCAVAAHALAAGILAAGVPYGQSAPAGQTPAQQPPVFRGGANLVTVDVYPRRDGRVIEGLTQADFEVIEDGKPQAIAQFEFVRIQAVPEELRPDPNNQRDMLRQAADPHNRVFVAYLDVHHVSVEGSHAIRGPLVDMLNRIIAPNDLFGVTTSKVRPSSLTLGRRLLGVEEQFSRYWPWGERNRISRDPDDAKEDYLDICFDQKDKDGKPVEADDEGVSRPFKDILIDRRREEAALRNLGELVAYVGAMREARTLMVLVTDGWRLFRPDPRLLERQSNPGLPPVGVYPGGRIGTMTELGPTYSAQACAAELARLAAYDGRARFEQIIAQANRANVVFYPVNPGGLEPFDAPPVRTDMDVVPNMDRKTRRIDSVEALALNTDGIAVTHTNDLRAGLNRIVNDVSAYYLLGYYSTNPRADGKYRQIKVRIRQDKVDVSARRGYVASAEPPAAARPAVAAGPPLTDVTEGLAMIARQGAELVTYGAVSGTDLVVVAEIASRAIEVGRWRAGGEVTVTVTGPDGQAVGTASGRIDPGLRGVLLRVPYGAGPGPWHVGVTLSSGDGESLSDRLDVRMGAGSVLGDPIAFRAAGGARAALRPVADFAFRRTERLRLEFPVQKPVDERSARILDRRGQAMPLPVAVTTFDQDGRPWLAADLGLSPLSPGDYVMEIAVTGAGERQRRQIGFRIVP